MLPTNYSTQEPIIGKERDRRLLKTLDDLFAKDVFNERYSSKEWELGNHDAVFEIQRRNGYALLHCVYVRGASESVWYLTSEINGKKKAAAERLGLRVENDELFFDGRTLQLMDKGNPYLYVLNDMVEIKENRKRRGKGRAPVRYNPNMLHRNGNGRGRGHYH